MYTGDTDSIAKNYVTQIPISVLLIDDEFLIGEAMRIKLSSEHDILFHFCKDPDKALEEAYSVKPTVIMLDLVMPGVNGLTMVKFFKSSEDLRDIPLIVLSAREEPELKKKAIALGANDYIIKLPDKIELVARIRCHSERYIFKRQRDELIMKLESGAISQDNSSLPREEDKIEPAAAAPAPTAGGEDLFSPYLD